MSQSTTKLTATRHVLAVNNLEKSADYYKNVLGFTTDWQGEGWHFLYRDSFFVMLGECVDETPAFETNNHSYFAYVNVSNIDELYKEYQAKNVEILAEISNKPWGQREFPIRTIDGHRIMFGERIE